MPLFICIFTVSINKYIPTIERPNVIRLEIYHFRSSCFIDILLSITVQREQFIKFYLESGYGE